YDILGDPQKRTMYDMRLTTPFAEIFSSPVPQHRDPAYRRRRTRPPRQKEPPASYILMRDSLPYVIWISKIALVFTTLFFIDYVIPYRQVDDYIQQVYSLRTRSDIHYVILTRGGEEIDVYDTAPVDFRNGRNIRLGVTRIYGSIMSVSNSSGTYKAWVAYMYTTLVFFPVVLFVNSLMALIYRKRVEFCFNLNVTAFVLLIINLILI